ncbi:MAG: hypothetical protein L3K23_09060 [Thermoplasmata archaeon]|nr:hypothetical protein [Thermoplasmata archaeon]
MTPSPAQPLIGRLAAGWWKFLMNPYHYLVLPLLALFAVFPSFLAEMLRNGTWNSPFDYSSAVYPVTYVTAVAVFLGLLWMARTRFGWWLGAFYSLGCVFGSVGLFELVFDEFFPNTLYLLKLAMFTFVLFGLASFRSWRFHAVWLLLVIVWVTLFFAWVFINPTLPPVRAATVPFAFNAITKVVAFGVFSLPFALGLRRRPPL